MLYFYDFHLLEILGEILFDRVGEKKTLIGLGLDWVTSY